MVSTRLLRSEYPFPRCTRKLALALVALWSAGCLAAIVVFGAHFDLFYDACVATDGAADTCLEEQERRRPSARGRRRWKTACTATLPP